MEKQRLLWNDLKREVNMPIETQIEHDYSQVFELCDDSYLGKRAHKPLLQLLQSVRDPTASFNDELYFTQIRLLLETMFKAANKAGFLHDKCIERGKANLTESSLFLSGLPTRHLGIVCHKTHFNEIISKSVKSILSITGAGSHKVDPDIINNADLVQYRSIINTPYLLYSLTFQLIDVLIWFKKYADENPDAETNKSHWLSSEDNLDEWIKGTIVSLHAKGFAFFKPDQWGTNTYVPPAIVAENTLANGDIVMVQNEDYEDSRTQEIKTRVKALRKT